MSLRTLEMTEPLYQYWQTVNPKEHAEVKLLREATLQLTQAEMMSSPEQAVFFNFLIKMLHPKKILEVGTFTGYATLSMALASPLDCEVITCDIDERWPKMGASYWERAGVLDKITVKIAPALDTLKTLFESKAQFDFIFIDADKKNYWDYLLYSLKLLSPGGIIAVDNTLWGGKVADPAIEDAQTLAIREFNTQLSELENVIYSILPLGDGLTLVERG
jgi:predicted O-methyltransferase YrrM